MLYEVITVDLLHCSDIIKGPFFFGSTTFILDKVDKIYNIKNVVLDCSLVSFMDLSAVYALSETIEKLRSQGTTVYLVARNNFV